MKLINNIAKFIKAISSFIIVVFFIKISEDVIFEYENTIYNINELKLASLFIGIIIMIFILAAINNVILHDLKNKDIKCIGYYIMNKKIIRITSDEIIYKNNMYYFINNPININDKKNIRIIPKDNLIKIEIIEI